MVRQGKALYIGISNYSAEQTAEIAAIFKDLKTPFIIHQPAYNMYNRWIEDGLQDVLTANKLGTIAFSPLAQGMLTDRYLHGIPEDSRAGRSSSPFLNAERVQETIEKSRAALTAKLGSDNLAFRVVVEEGKPKIKAAIKK